VRITGRPGDTLTFPALQTYDSGEVVHWIGPPDAEEPAPRLTVTGESSGEAAAASSSGARATASAPAGDDGGRDGLTLALSIAGLAAALAALALVLRRRRA
jgi:uncharacterized protein